MLEPTNDSAAGLPLGTAVVNTAGGLGGPRGATRGHERTVRFPDPHADRAALSALRHRLWEGRAADAAPPRVFAGYAHQHLDDDPTYRAALAGRSARPTALLGRNIDVALTTATFPLDTTPGRHLAVLGPSAAGAELLDAAVRSLAAHHPPRTARFVISSLVAEGDGLAARAGGRPAGAAGGGDGRRGRARQGADRRPARLPGRVRHGRDRPGRGARRPAARGAPLRPEPRRPPAVLVARPAPVQRGGRRQQRPRRRRRPRVPQRARDRRVADGGPAGRLAPATQPRAAARPARRPHHGLRPVRPPGSDE